MYYYTGRGPGVGQPPANLQQPRERLDTHLPATARHLSLSPIQQELAAAGTLELELVGSSPSLGRQLGCKAAHYQPVNL